MPVSAKLSIYAINLDRSVERWKLLTDRAQASGLDLVRVPAIDGRAISAEQRIHARPTLFRMRNGRTMLPGEYGCYQSHLAALRSFVESGAPAAVIVEDDVELIADLDAQAAAILDAVPQADLVKLLNHRNCGFLRKASSSQGHDIGRCLHGPLGSAACYLVTIAGARKLLEGLSVMSLPYDIALERGWALGIEAYTVRNNVLPLGVLRSQTEIATSKQYGAVKIRNLSRLLTHGFRAADYLRRLAYALRVPFTS